MIARRWLAVLVLALAGCHAPARMTFSPDGSRAVYASNVDGLLRLVDADGTVVTTLGRGSGAAAWTADGRTVYFAARSEQPPPLAERDDGLWIANLRGLDLFAVPEPGSLDEPVDPGDTLYRWRDGTVTPLAALGGAAWNLQLSPDEQSLLLSLLSDVPVMGNTEQVGLLAAYSISEEKLRPITAMQGLNLLGTFTADGDILCARPATLDAPIAELVRVSPKQPDAEPAVLAVLASPASSYLSRHGQTVLLSTVPLTLPLDGRAIDGNLALVHRLCRVNLEARTLEPLVASVGQFFAISPDGTRVLVEQVTPRGPGEPPARSLAVVSLDGSNLRPLRPLEGYEEKLPMFPAWRTPDELAFVVPPDHAASQRFEDKSFRAYDVMLYRLGETGMEQLRPLSSTWPPEARPGVEIR